MSIVNFRRAVDLGIHQDFHCQAEGGAHRIIEADSGSKNSSVLIRPGKGGVTVLSFDKKKIKGERDPIYPYFKETVAGLCQKCDAIAVFSEGNNSWILALELKSRNISGISGQLRAGVCFARFLASRLQFIVGGDVGTIMIGAVAFALSPVPLKRSRSGVLDFKDVGGVRAALVYDRAEIRITELLDFVVSHGLAKPMA